MSKKILALLMATLLMVAAVAGCRGADTPVADDSVEVSDSGATSEPAEGTDAPAENFKIGIMTGTVSQGEEEFQAAVNMKEKYGDMIVTGTYPDNFSAETETTISNVVAMASDPDVKVIVFLQAVPGASAAIDKVRETRDDILFIAGVPGEDPTMISSKADIVLMVDDLSMGSTVPQQAVRQGAKTLIHYSFPRHLSYATIAARRQIMIDECEKLGLEFVDVTAPDPTGDSGVAGAQQFILEDLPRQVEKYGKDTAFFSTNCSMMEPIIRATLEVGAIFPQQCCPSPYHGYPAALGIDVTGHEGDVQYMLDQITEKVVDGGNAGRMSTWAVPINMLMIEAGVEYGIAFAEGQTDGRVDEKVLYEKIEEVGLTYGTTTVISKYIEDDVTIENFYLLLADYYNFGDLPELGSVETETPAEETPAEEVPATEEATESESEAEETPAA